MGSHCWKYYFWFRQESWLNRACRRQNTWRPLACCEFTGQLPALFSNRHYQTSRRPGTMKLAGLKPFDAWSDCSCTGSTAARLWKKNPKFSSQFLHPWGTPVKKTKDKNCIFIKKEILFLTHCMYPQARVWWYCLCACFFGHFEPSHSALHHWETKVRWSSLNSRWQQQCLMFPCKVVLQRLPGRMCSLFKTQHLQCPEGS